MKKGILALVLVVPMQMVFATPVDTYFSFAITENSNAHGGDNLLYLDFQESMDVSARSPRTVISPKISGSGITLDASLNDWHQEQFTSFQTRVMNNYPLDSFYDVVSTDVQLASAHDDEYIYFAVKYTDANLDASNNRERWIKENGKWQSYPRTRPAAASLVANSLNASVKIAGVEDEDRVFFMFPMVDNQHNFRDQGHGCAGYCHGNLLESGDPRIKRIGQGVSNMHTNASGDIADVWQWTATRTAPANTLRDGFISSEGHKADTGEAAYTINKQRLPKGPAYVSKTDHDAGRYTQGDFSTARLDESDLMPIKLAGTVGDGTRIPYYINRAPTGSRGDVEVASRFDHSTHQWIIELKRKLDTGRPDEDRIFTSGLLVSPPSAPAVARGNPKLGQELFKDKKCFACHGDKGEGKHVDGAWIFPRIQRASGALIAKTASPDRPKRLAALAFKHNNEASRTVVMPSIDLTMQQAEHIAAWLQTQYTPLDNTVLSQ